MMRFNACGLGAQEGYLADGLYIVTGGTFYLNLQTISPAMCKARGPLPSGPSRPAMLSLPLTFCTVHSLAFSRQIFRGARFSTEVLADYTLTLLSLERYLGTANYFTVLIIES